jgi:hypothetical protein
VFYFLYIVIYIVSKFLFLYLYEIGGFWLISLLSACLCIAIGFSRGCAGHLAGPGMMQVGGMMQGTMQQVISFIQLIAIMIFS